MRPSYLQSTQDFHSNLFMLSCYLNGEFRLDCLSTDKLNTLMRLEHDLDELDDNGVDETIMSYLKFHIEPGVMH